MAPAVALARCRRLCNVVERLFRHLGLLFRFRFCDTVIAVLGVIAAGVSVVAGGPFDFR